ncbi:tetratricopeptide repeat protein (plasmid) [Bacillus velezensis]|uniref:Rap family tetratricopeptide repeat protein n=1 Tax=Bacillus velezensis TaxID=492670 RepID=UPI0028E9B4A1|nr:Rap family tetratricopeptide repeat protein [Bacillus velezensis]WNR83213.1 Rap family tetratricopeptide repeat protein [Bacillus velezensis]
MNTKIAFEPVGQALNEWYRTIMKNDIDKAKMMREDIQTILPDMEENEYVLIYFKLIDIRLKLLIERYEESGDILGEIREKALRTPTDDIIQYYFFFFSGMYEFYCKKYTKAITNYKIAEKMLGKIPDEIEKAEFHYQVAIAYYQIRQNLISLNHAENALESYQAHDDYISRTIKCKMLFAMNKVDLQLWDDATQLYQDAIRLAKKSQDRISEALGYFNLGLCYERQEQLTKAKSCFESAVEIPEHLESIHSSIRSMYMLSRVYYKMGTINKGREWRDIALRNTENVNEDVYKAKLNIIYFLYDNMNLKELDVNMTILKEKKLWSDVAELSENVAVHFKKKNDSKISSKYFEEASKAKDQILRLTEDACKLKEKS